LVLLIRDVAVRVWQEVAGKDLRSGEEHEKHRRTTKRFGPKTHLYYLAISDPERIFELGLARPLYTRWVIGSKPFVINIIALLGPACQSPDRWQ
jgi:hypothetical protein